MTAAEQYTLFAFDCGATNWRLYRSQYEITGIKARLIGEPSPSPLTSFADRRLPAVLQLSPDGTRLESFGENAQSQIEDESGRLRIRDYFKPCIGAHLEDDPQPHQLRFTSKEALEFTRMMLDAVLAQLLREKLRTGSFDEKLIFTFAYPVHWQTSHKGDIFEEFVDMVRSCFPSEIHKNIRFVSEPEGAIFSLQRGGHLQQLSLGKTTLIFDVGGSTTDIVAGEVESTSGELLFMGRYGEAFGGGHYDAVIANSISDELRIPASAIAKDPSALLSLRNVAKGLKESLSRQLLFSADSEYVTQRTVTLVMRDGEIYRDVVKLDQAQFESLTKDLSTDFSNLIETSLEKINLTDEDIGQIVLVGGGAQLYSIVRALEERFSGISLILADNPDESVVLGCGLEYGASTSKSRPSLVFMPGFDLDALQTATIESYKYMLESSEGEEYPLVAGDNRVGRAITNEVHIVGKRISRLHAKIVISDGAVEVIDLGSTNGTFVNEVRLEKDQTMDLQTEDELRFGNQSYLLKHQQE